MARSVWELVDYQNELLSWARIADQHA